MWSEKLQLLSCHLRASVWKLIILPLWEEGFTWHNITPHSSSLSPPVYLFPCLTFLALLQALSVTVWPWQTLLLLPGLSANAAIQHHFKELLWLVQRKPVQWQLSRVFFHYAKWHLLSMGHWRSMWVKWSCDNTLCM